MVTNNEGPDFVEPEGPDRVSNAEPPRISAVAAERESVLADLQTLCRGRECSGCPLSLFTGVCEITLAPRDWDIRRIVDLLRGVI